MTSLLHFRCLKVDRLGAHVASVESEMTKMMERHSTEASSWLAATRQTEEEYAEVRGSVLWRLDGSILTVPCLSVYL
jgi:hypothetical protein